MNKTIFFILLFLTVIVKSQTDSLILYKINGDNNKIITLSKKLILQNKADVKTFLILSDTYAELGNYSESTSVLNSGLKKYKNNEELLFLKAKIQYKNNQFLKALETTNLIGEENAPKVLTLKYNILTSLKQYTEALNCIEKLIDTDSTSYKYYYLQGKTLKRLNHLKSAVNSFRIAIKLNPVFDKAYYSIASIFTNIDRHTYQDSAYKYIVIADSLMPGKKSYITLKAKILYTKKDYTNALNEYQKLLQFDKNNKTYMFRAGVCYMDNKNFSTAKEYFHKCYKNDSSFYKYAQYLGMTYFYLHDYLKASFYLKKSLELTQPDKLILKSLYRQLANLNFSISNYKECIEYYSKIIELSPGDIDANYYMAESYFKLKNYRKALRYYDIVATSDIDKDFYNHIISRKRIINENLFFESNKNENK